MSDPRPAAKRSKRGRLTRSADFERVFRRGRSFGNRHLVLHLFPRSGPDEAREPRIGLSVSRRVGGAVDRNLVKRLLREAFADQSSRFPTSVDLVIVARPDARELAEREGLAGISTALEEIVQKALTALDNEDAG
ncbi:Ribonuclease P protein component [Patulibacter medicamentivorans]|jgi:ribonuclease P protein component|uniref:Ribonuclease P protein component n=1 Tax=Patulibacter medicamentivorans TaxID=1097667 RepID=H0E9J6_9ACTN|nr:ribonuclease P protein component [Patulibacter medicamentivorans]EHN09638.1 Ribonuclease P protein component [Patulibacter medicamentivorans]